MRKNKKNNKGFSLVELVIVVAILAILVGILAPQYTKYVEKSRQSADVSNLENLIQGFKVAAADTDYDVIAADAATPATYTIVIKQNGTSIVAENAPTTNGRTWDLAIKEYTGFSFSGTSLDKPLTDIKLKSAKWSTEKDTVAIKATVTIASDGSVSVDYDPKSVKDVVNKK